MCKYHGHLELTKTILTGIGSDACDSLLLLFTPHGEICCKSLVSPSLLYSHILFSIVLWSDMNQKLHYICNIRHHW